METRFITFNSTNDTEVVILDRKEVEELWKPHITISPSKEPEVYDQNDLALMLMYKNGSIHYEGK